MSLRAVERQHLLGGPAYPHHAKHARSSAILATDFMALRVLFIPGLQLLSVIAGTLERSRALSGYLAKA
jgi:hypothetical protein